MKTKGKMMDLVLFISIYVMNVLVQPTFSHPIMLYAAPESEFDTPGLGCPTLLHSNPWL